MTLLAATASLKDAPTRLSDDHLTWLSRTYDRSLRPVWVHDLAARCVYQNPSAQSVPWDDSDRLVFEIIDHKGRTVGHLATLES